MQKLHQQYLPHQYPVYNGPDLGLTYTKDAAAFRIWSPPAEAAELLLYKNGAGAGLIKIIQLTKGDAGTWFTKLEGDHKGFFYVYKVKINGQWSGEIVDPYARAVGTNGKRAMIADLTKTDPPGWPADISPAFSTNNYPTDAIIYELHIRDAGIHENSGIIHKGKYKGLAEIGTSCNGVTTGLSHLKELGVTHIHLLPFFDFNSVDESDPHSMQYNWGYDPLNYNVPEGSYSSDPADGITRIRELKQLVAAFHTNGLRVVMDVVYNHTALSDTSNFNQLVPGYYYRHTKDGRFSNASGCGNETASERPMMQKFMLNSLLYWVKEYHVDGFRFDLMGVHDIETMNMISAALHAEKPGILLYGEGWTAGHSPVPDSLRAVKKNVRQLKGIAVFCDEIRDGIKGSIFKLQEKGFVSGNIHSTESVKFGIVAACYHPQVNYKKVNYSDQPYATAPGNMISYCECHDNHTLWDKLALSNPDSSVSDRKKMHQLALTIVLTSQGIPFLHAGGEFFRSKQGVENSYKSNDSINAINWNLKAEHHEMVMYIQQLIHLRKTHSAFRMTTAGEVAKNIIFDETAPEGTIVYSINAAAIGDSWNKLWLSFNGSEKEKRISLPAGHWKDALRPNTDAIYMEFIELEKHSSMILYQ